MWGRRTGTLLRVSGLWPTGVLRRRPLNCNAASLAGSNSLRCWNCGGLEGPLRGDRFFCPQCRALQPPDPTQDYFSLMDCNRSFRVDTAKLQHRYQQLQRLVHPDFFSQKSQVTYWPPLIIPKHLCTLGGWRWPCGHVTELTTSFTLGPSVPSQPVLDLSCTQSFYLTSQQN